MDDPSLCGTCGLKWLRSARHPPCLKLSPEERRLLGATAEGAAQSTEDTYA